MQSEKISNMAKLEKKAQHQEKTNGETSTVPPSQNSGGLNPPNIVLATKYEDGEQTKPQKGDGKSPDVPPVPLEEPEPPVIQLPNNAFLATKHQDGASIGLYPISLGMTIVVSSVWTTEFILGSLFMGTFMFALASLGHYGAVAGKNSILVIYASVVGLVTVVELALIPKFSIHKLTIPLIFLFFITALTLSSVLLAVALSKQIQKTPPPPKSALELPSAPVAV